MPRKLSTGTGGGGKAKRQELHTIEPLAKPLELLKTHPVDAVHRTGLDRFLNASGAVSILADGSRTPQTWLDHKCVGCNVGAVPTANANRLINPDRFFPQCSAKNRLIACFVFSYGS